MKKIAISLASILLFIIGCSEENSPTQNESANEPFKVKFINEYNIGKGWVILHPENNQNTLIAQEYYNDGIVDFGELERTTVSFSIIYQRLLGTVSEFRILTFLDAPKGDWIFDGQNYLSETGTVTVDLTFPRGEYTHCFLGAGNSYSRRINGSLSNYSINNYNTYPNSGQNISLYSSVYNDETDSAYYGYLLNQPFTIGAENHYSINLDKKLNPSYISSNKEFDYINIRAYPNSLEEGIRLFSSSYYGALKLNHKVFYPNNFSANYFRTSIGTSSLTSETWWYYYKVDNKVLTNVNIPIGSITTDYNYGDNSFYNIRISGSYDVMTTEWKYNDENNFNYSHSVYLSAPQNSIFRPTFADNFLKQLSGFNENNLVPEGVSIIEYSGIESFEEFIEVFFKSELPHWDKISDYYNVGFRIN